MLSLLLWWLIIQLIGWLVGVPAAAALFRGAPAAGYAQSKALGLLLTGYAAWLLAMLGLAPFSRWTLLLLTLALGAIGWRARGPGAIARWVRERWGAAVTTELVFAAALVGMAIIRATRFEGADFTVAMFNPDPVATERPMDYALFHALQRSPIFPPHDPWLSGFSINYYYFGYLLAAIPAMLSGLAPGTAYNLALALVFALAAAGAAGLVADLLRSLLPSDGAGRLRRALLLACAAASTAASLLIAGNLAPAAMAIAGDARVVALPAPQLLEALAQGARGEPQVTLSSPVRTADGDFGTIQGWPRRPLPDSVSSWWSSRVLWDSQPAPPGEPPERRYAITEFPGFSFMLGDMHPHLIALPFCILTLALAWGALRAEEPALTASRAGLPALAGAACCLGALYAINSWDFPTYALVLGAAVALNARSPGGDAAPLPWRAAAASVAALLALSVALYAPFYLTFRPFAGQEPTVHLPILDRVSATVGIYTGARTGLHTFALIFGAALTPLAWYVALAARSRPALLLAAAVPAAAAVGAALAFPLLALIPAGLLALALASAPRRPPADRFALLALAAGCAVCAAAEVVYLRDVFEGWQPRFNTVFKLSYQAWVLFGVAGAFATWRVAAWPGLRKAARAAFLATVAAAAVASAVYPLQTYWRVIAEGRMVGLEGRTLRERTPAGAAGVAWLRTQAAPQSVVLEMVGESYDAAAGAVSAGSGLATVLGWPGHERQWRNGDARLLDEIGERRRDVDEIYQTLDERRAAELLARWRVRYVYVGAEERGRYPPDALAKFARLGRVAFQQDEVSIYELAPADSPLAP